MSHKLAHKWAWRGRRDPISKFRDPQYFVNRRDKAMLFKFGTQTEPEQFLPMEHKSARKLGGIGHVTQFHNLIWDPVIISRTDEYMRFKFGTQIQRGSFDGL